MPDTLHGKTVLDAGCGSRRYMLHALRGGAARVVGVALSSQMLARPDTALGTRRRGVPTGLVRGSVCALPVADARADLTICGLVAGHVERSEEHTSDLQSLMPIPYASLCFKT